MRPEFSAVYFEGSVQKIAIPLTRSQFVGLCISVLPFFAGNACPQMNFVVIGEDTETYNGGPMCAQ
jgi:hypothetical protein